jgi:hypothetical protein
VLLINSRIIDQLLIKVKGFVKFFRDNGGAAGSNAHFPCQSQFIIRYNIASNHTFTISYIVYKASYSVFQSERVRAYSVLYSRYTSNRVSNNGNISYNIGVKRSAEDLLDPRGSPRKGTNEYCIVLRY